MNTHLTSLHNAIRTLNFWRMDPRLRTIKFADDLLILIRLGQKTITYRLDGKYSDIKAGDRLFYKGTTGPDLGIITITRVEHRLFKDIPAQSPGHEPYEDKAHQVRVFTSYYGRVPKDDDRVDILYFYLSGQVSNQRSA